MGNDTKFVQIEDLPFRLIEIPAGSAPPPPSIRTCHTQNRRHAPPIPSRVQGYDAPPSLLPPPIPPKRFDQPIIDPPQRFDLPQSRCCKDINEQIARKKTIDHRRKLHKGKFSCCVIS